MESDIQQHHRLLHDQQYQLHHRQMNSGLTRYQSAPSSYFTNLVDRKFCEQFVNRPSSPETERIFARFMTSDSGTHHTPSHRSGGIERISPVGEAVVAPETDRKIPCPASTVKIEAGDVIQNQSDSSPISYASRTFHQNQWRPPLPNKNLNSGMETTYSMGMSRLPPMRTGGSGDINSNFLRQYSLPADLFSHVNVLNGAGSAGMRDMREVKSRISDTEQKSFTSGSTVGNSIRRQTFSMGEINTIADSNKKSMLQSNPENTGIIGEDKSDYLADFLLDYLDENTMLSDNLYGQKRLGVEDDDAGMLQNQPPVLGRHLSLPNTCSELGAVQKLLQFSDSVLCKARAKRGCATHPRSIAERVRRSRISERMRKLQELVPNMDKQTNTSEMLELAVDYIKDLQKQLQTLSDNREKCTCSNTNRKNQRL